MPVLNNNQLNLVGFIFGIANKLRGPYRPPQYRRVMLPLTVLRRLDCVLEPTKEAVLEQYNKLKAQGLPEPAIHKILSQPTNGRPQGVYNLSPYTFKKLTDDPDHIAKNLVSYIKGFSQQVQDIFDRFDFEKEIVKLDNANRLFEVIREFSTVDLHPDTVKSIEMGYIFEELVRRFNEQANEEAGDHFTPREVIRLMANLIYTGDEDIYISNIVRTVYDPTCGTGGMLAVSEEYIKEHNPKANLLLYGQDYNEESWAICCSDMLIKEKPVDNIVWGDVLGDGKTSDGHPDKKFHYMMANPPFGVEWKPQKNVVEDEYSDHGFSGRFGPGLPRISDGALLFLLHMTSKMHPAPEQGGEGSKIAIVFNGSPLFAGEPGPSESNIRRWIIENDWLDAIVALPDQLFYNTGIYTYIWLVSNRKPEQRKGKVQLVDATQHYLKMKKSLGNKRNEIGDGNDGKTNHIDDITRIYANYEQNGISELLVDNMGLPKVCSKIFDNKEFAYLRLTVERPLRLNFQATPERIERLKEYSAFNKLAESKKKHGTAAWKEEVEAGKALQQQILDMLGGMDAGPLYRNRDMFEALLNRTAKAAKIKLAAPVKKAVMAALSERDPEADICYDADGNPEPDPELRDTEIVKLPETVSLPLPMDYDKEADNSALLALVQPHCEAYFEAEVKPYWPDAWVDFSKTKLGYEIPFNQHFYTSESQLELQEIEAELSELEGDILKMLKEVVQ